MNCIVKMAGPTPPEPGYMSKKLKDIFNYLDENKGRLAFTAATGATGGALAGLGGYLANLTPQQIAALSALGAGVGGTAGYYDYGNLS